MKPEMAIGLLMFSLVLVGCTTSSSNASPTPAASVTATAAVSVAALECRTDSDCVTSGCSGQLCQSKSSPSGITTCEYRDEYACYKPEGCLCQAGKCAWSDATVQCIQDAGKLAGQTEAEFNCVQSCREARYRGTDLSQGPCLSNAAAADWVCDVAHAPRQAVDNLEQNTCPAFGVSANHFVEVDEGCTIIQSA